jgi:hypothetical protein
MHENAALSAGGIAAPAFVSLLHEPKITAKNRPDHCFFTETITKNEAIRAEECWPGSSRWEREERSSGLICCVTTREKSVGIKGALVAVDAAKK